MGQKGYLLSVLEDMAQAAENSSAVTYSDFYEPQLQYQIEREIGRYPASGCDFWGGHEYCERKMLAVYPSGASPEYSDYPLDCLQCENINADISHRDVLGALIGLGIKREKIGDINIDSGKLQIIVSSPLGEYVEKNLTKVNIFNISLKISDAIWASEPHFITMDVIVPSMRLDAVIHAAYKLSRSDAAEYIKAQKVSINHLPALKPSAALKCGDVVSVRTKGRMIIDEQLGSTHKGNIRLRLKKFA